MKGGFYIVSMNLHLTTYLSKHPKYKLVFDLSSSLDVESIDTGVFLANALKRCAQEDHLDLCANDVVRKMIGECTHTHPHYGRYVALSNIAILFEPALSLNLETIIEQISKDILLIIQAEGVVENSCFYFLSRQYNLSIDLNNLDYTTID